MDTDQIAIAILVGTFALFLGLGFHIILAVGFATIITTVYLDIPLLFVLQQIVGGINVFTLMAVPFFILMGELMGAGGISTRMIKLADSVIGWLRGGLGMVNVSASMFFGGISGAASADVASIGSILIPIMKEKGYDEDFATSITLSSSIQGIIIPPSHNMIIYSLAAGGVSVGRLFMAGIAPGVLLGVALMIYTYIIALRRDYPRGDKFSLMGAVKGIAESFMGLVTILIVVVGVVAGVFTPTESAAIAVLYAMFLTFIVYREIGVRDFPKILGRVVKTMSIVLILIGLARAFGWLIAYLNVPAMLASGITAISSNPVVILLIIMALMLVLGMVMGMTPLIIILTPILLPIVTDLGIHPVHFGIMMILNLGIGLITPPVGAVLFVGSAVSGLTIERLSKALLPHYVVMFIVLLVVYFVPGFVMFLPNLVMP